MSDELLPAGEVKKGGLQDTLYKEIVEDYLEKLETLKSASAADNLKEITTTNISLAETYFSLGDFTSALYHYGQAALCEETLDIWEDRVKIFEKMGEIYTNLSKWDEALNCFKNAREIAEQNKDDTEHWAIKMSEIFHGMGRVNWRLGNYDRAEHYIKLGITLSKSKDVNTSNNYVELGNLTVERGQIDNAVEYYNKALDILNEIGDMYYQSRIFNNLSDLYLQAKDFEKALEYAEKCIENSTQTQNRRLLAFGYITGGEVLARMDDIERALEFCQKGEEIFLELEEPYSLGSVQFIYALIHEKKGDLDKAKEAMLKAIGLYEEANIPYYLATAQMELAKLEEKSGDRTAALERASKAKDIFSNLKAEKRVGEAEQLLKSLQE